MNHTDETPAHMLDRIDTWLATIGQPGALPPGYPPLSDDYQPGPADGSNRWLASADELIRDVRSFLAVAGSRPASLTVYNDFAAERDRAHRRHATTSAESSAASDPTGRRLRILIEEVGEVAREFNDADHEQRTVNLGNVRRELVQVGAMAASWCASIDEMDCGPDDHVPDPAASEASVYGWTYALVMDRHARVWQHKDSWVCVTKRLGDIDIWLPSGEATCPTIEVLAERWGPLTTLTDTGGVLADA